MTTPDPILQRLQHIEQLIASGDLATAAPQLDELAAIAPQDARVQLLGACMAEAAGRPDDALHHTRWAVRLQPRWSVPATQLALLLARMGRTQDALVAAQQAVALAPDSVPVLSAMVDIAQQALNPQLALGWLERAVPQAPANADLKRQMVRTLSQLGHHAHAVLVSTQLLDLQPHDLEARLGRAKAALSAGDTALARQDTDALLARAPNNATYQFWGSVARGEVPPTQPADMMRSLFDGYAPVFDMHLVDGLKYRVPAQVAALVGERYPDGALDLLDLGCGTGLLGKCLGRTQGLLVGVDLSPGMLSQAAELKLYDDFLVNDLLSALQAIPEACYDVVAACDVFIYSGDLTEVVPAAAHVLKPGGHFIFSCESAQDSEADLVLRPSTRYAHKASHVRALCAAAGFTDVTLQDTTIRVEAGEPIAGFIAIARKAP